MTQEEGEKDAFEDDRVGRNETTKGKKDIVGYRRIL